MDNGIHFISGLPRSGSTLLSVILRQDPLFHAGMSSPVAPLVNSLLNVMSARGEWATLFDDDQRQNVLQAVIEGYYPEHPSKAAGFRYEPNLVRQNGCSRSTVSQIKGCRLRTRPRLDHGFIRTTISEKRVFDVKNVFRRNGHYRLYPDGKPFGSNGGCGDALGCYSRGLLWKPLGSLHCN